MNGGIVKGQAAIVKSTDQACIGFSMALCALALGSSVDSFGSLKLHFSKKASKTH